MNSDLIERIRKQHAPFVGSDDVRVHSSKVKSPNVDRDKRLVAGYVSMAVPDLDNEVVLPAGMDRSYFPKQIKSVYWSHNYDMMPVGKCVKLGLRDGGTALYAQTYISKGAFGDDLLEAMDTGVVEGFSVGLKIRRDDDVGAPTKDEIKQYGQCDTMVRTSRLIEYSITPMPACPGATVEQKTISELDRLVTKGVIRISSAWLMGLPKETAKPKRKAVWAGGAMYVRAVG